MRPALAALRRALQAVRQRQLVVLAAAMWSTCCHVQEDKGTLPHSTGQAVGRDNKFLLAVVRTRQMAVQSTRPTPSALDREPCVRRSLGQSIHMPVLRLT